MTIETQLRALGTHLDDAQDPITVDDIRGSVDAVDSGQDEFGFDNGDSPSPVRWLAVAAIIIVVLVGIWLVAQRVNDDEVPADTPPGVTITPSTVAEASDVVSGFFDAYGSADVDALAGLLADDVDVAMRYGRIGSADHSPTDHGRGTAPAEHQLAWMMSAGELLTEPTCSTVSSQPSEETVVRCDYTSRGALAQAIDASPARSRTTITVADGKITAVRVEHDNREHADLAGFFEQWQEQLGLVSVWRGDVDEEFLPGHFPANTVEEVADLGRLSKWLARSWSEYLDEHDCPTLEPCDVHGGSQILETIFRDNALFLEPYEHLVTELPGYPHWDAGDSGGSQRLDWVPSGCRYAGVHLYTAIVHDFGTGTGLTGTEPGMPLLDVTWGAAPPARAQVAVDLIDFLATCLPPDDVEELPPSIPADGFIFNDTHALFAVTHPRGGQLLIHLRDGQEITELVTQIAGIADQILTDTLS